jgi:hypothetical protein
VQNPEVGGTAHGTQAAAQDGRDEDADGRDRRGEVGTEMRRVESRSSNDTRGASVERRYDFGWRGKL